MHLIAPELAGKILLLLAPNFKLERAQNIVDADVFVARAMPNVAAGIGASRLLQSGKRPSELKDAVCSPAGTTIEGLATLEAAGFRAAVMAAIEACIAKARGGG